MLNARCINRSNEILSPRGAQPRERSGLWPSLTLSAVWRSTVRTTPKPFQGQYEPLDGAEKSVQHLVPVPWACFTSGDVTCASFWLGTLWSCGLALPFLEWAQGLGAHRPKTGGFLRLSIADQSYIQQHHCRAAAGPLFWWRHTS